MQGQDEGQELTAVTAYLAERARDAARAVGVYALYNERQELQYVGFARNVAGAIQVHSIMCMAYSFKDSSCPWTTSGRSCSTWATFTVWLAPSRYSFGE